MNEAIFLSRITVVSPYFWPEVVSCVPLMTSLTEDLVARGFEVEVLTSAPVRWDDGVKIADEGQKRVPLRDRFRGAHVVRLRNPFPRRAGARAKLLEYAWFSLWVCLRLLFGRSVDAVYVYSNPPLIGLAIGWIGRLRRMPVVYNLQDLFPDSAVAGGLLPVASRAVGVLRRLERWTYTAVSSVAAISPEFAEHVRRHAPNARVTVIPNWIDTEEVFPASRTENLFLEGNGVHGDPFIVLYSGNLGFLHGLDALLDAASLLRDVPDLLFFIVGEGQQKERLRERAREMGLNNCRFFDFQPYAMIRHVYSAGDVCVVPMRRGAVSAAIPSKTWSIMACERPIIACMEPGSELARALTGAEAGIVVEPENGVALAAAVCELRADRARRERMGRRGREYVEAQLSRKVITARYAALFQSLSPRAANGIEHAREGEVPALGLPASRQGV